jgi:hypothetical protein
MAAKEAILANLIALGFDNPSASAIYNKQAEALGLVVDTTLTEISNSENRIFNIINTQRYGKSGYYTGIALAFQMGDNLVEDPGTLDNVYAVVDPSKRIVSQAAFEEIVNGSASQLFLKIATLNPLTGLLEQLSTTQYEAFKNYWGNFEIPGLPVSVVNKQADILFFNAKATVFATYDLPSLQANLLTALNKFRTTFAFNGEFFAGDLQDYIKANVPGVRDFFIYSTTLDNIPFAGSISLPAGYFNYADKIETYISYTSA